MAFEDFSSGLTTPSFHKKGTLLYASPEMVLRGAGRSLEADVWAYGCLALEVWINENLPGQSLTRWVI